MATNKKHTTPQGVTINTTYFCPKKLLKPSSQVIPPPQEFVLQFDIFPSGTTNPTDIQKHPTVLQESMEKYQDDRNSSSS